MNLTVGPLPSAVYWRRRALVAAPLLVILLTLSTCIASGSDGSPQKPAAKTVQEPTEAALSPSPSALVPVLPTLSSSASTAASPSPSTPVSPAGPATCLDTDLDLVATMEKTTIRVGAHPRLKLAVTNTSPNQCVRDVGSGQQELSVVQGARTLWSSDHCSPNRGTDLRTLFPGEKRTYWLDWSGRTSDEGCPKTRSEVGPGTYQVVARLGTLVSKPLEFTIKK
jgi:hypothetical protein